MCGQCGGLQHDECCAIIKMDKIKAPSDNNNQSDVENMERKPIKMKFKKIHREDHGQNYYHIPQDDEQGPIPQKIIKTEPKSPPPNTTTLPSNVQTEMCSNNELEEVLKTLKKPSGMLDFTMKKKISNVSVVEEIKRGCNTLGEKVCDPMESNPIKCSIPQQDQDLHPKTPSVQITSKTEAFSNELVDFCLKNPICVVRGISSACDMKLEMFSTKNLLEVEPDHAVEIRTQNFTGIDVNIDPTGFSSWELNSVKDETTVHKYAYYQAETFLKENERKNEGKQKQFQDKDNDEDDEEDYLLDDDDLSSGRKFPGSQIIRFGTNVDLSDTVKWEPQLKELDKLPGFAKVFSPGNMLSHVGHPILGMNTVQLYMKVRGCRTPGHQENNNFSAVNINIGPGDSEWFATDGKYWEDIYRLCKQNGINYLKGAWWPDPVDCVKAGIPVYRFLQKPGDLVWINTGCVHWVQAPSVCNNIAWNVAPLTANQYRAAMERYEFNKVEKFKSIVPMLLLSWNLARNIKVADKELFSLIKRVLQNSLSHSMKIVDYVQELGVKISFYGRVEDEETQYCQICEEEVFQTLFILEKEELHNVYCIKCALELSSETLEGFACLLEYKTPELINVYESFKLVE